MVSEKKSTVVRVLKEEGLTIGEIALKLELKRASVRRYLRHARNKKPPRVLLLDIETSPVWVRVWGLYKQRIPFQNVIKDWFMLCWASKWLGEKEVMSDCVTPEEALERDDSRVTNSVWEAIDTAQVVIGHNLDKFDIRKLMARFIEHGFLKPSPFRTVDTLKQSRKHFAHSAHNLDYLNKIFSLRMKEDTDYQLWIDCEDGDKKALAYMLHYCESDVLALEDLYYKLRPYVTSHPNLALYGEGNEPMCPSCRSKDLIESGIYTTNVSVFTAYRCMNCGALSRGRKTEVSKEKRDGLLVPVVR